MGNGSGNTRISVRTFEDEATRKVEIDPATGKPRMVQRNLHASTTIETRPPAKAEELPEDRWTIVLVSARLRRMAELFTRFPMTADIRPAPIRSNMPEPVLERTRDYAPDPTTPRIPLRHTEIDLATATFKAVLALVWDNPIDRAILWSIALKKSFQDCADDLASARPPIKISSRALNMRWSEKLGPTIVDLFNDIPLHILPADLERARLILDRRLSTRKW